MYYFNLLIYLYIKRCKIGILVLVLATSLAATVVAQEAHSSAVRLYSDGIPGTMPDGQSQLSQFDLGSADHIEVLRGLFSALHGNSSGGVVAALSRAEIFVDDRNSDAAPG
jgi:outer membrane receptor protein involved in Fe transport